MMENRVIEEKEMIDSILGLDVEIWKGTPIYLLMLERKKLCVHFDKIRGEEMRSFCLQHLKNINNKIKQTLAL